LHHAAAARYSAFSFVDRITEFTPAQSAVGYFKVPQHVRSFPAALVAEAIGQLAAWVAMAHTDFRRRPVAALAGATHFHRDVAPGARLALHVALASCDEDSVAYGGYAMVDGVKVLELFDCVGAMLPQDEFDDPQDVRERFALLRGPGAPPGRFPGLDVPELTLGERVADASVQAQLHVPQAADFFADHFPRRPVFPATLLLDAQMRLAGMLVAGPPGTDALAPARLLNLKVRAWTLPGQCVDLSAELLPRDGEAVPARMTARVADKTVATSRVEFAVRAA